MNARRRAIWWAWVVAAVVLAGTPAVMASGDAADEAMARIRPEAIRAEMRFLSDDLLEGRGTATRGHEIAAKYMATQFEGMGLEPAGDGGVFSGGAAAGNANRPRKDFTDAHARGTVEDAGLWHGLHHGNRSGTRGEHGGGSGGIRWIWGDGTGTGLRRL